LDTTPSRLATALDPFLVPFTATCRALLAVLAISVPP
jgi:hypothetical protein